MSPQNRAELHLRENVRRSTVSLTLAFAIALELFLLSIIVAFPEQVHHLFASVAGFRITFFVINFLLVWLAIMLAVAFARWRETNRQKAQLDTVVSSISPDALLVVSPNREILACNPSVRRIFGWEESEILHQKTDLLYEDRRTIPGNGHEIYEALYRDGFHIGLATGKHKDGSKIPLEIITGELSGREGAVVLVRDIRERVQAEETRRKLQEKVAREQKMESLGVMVGGIAHDFNNLLAGIMGNAELALRALPPEDVESRQSLEEIVHATQEAAKVCRQMLAYTGKGRLHLTAIDLSKLIRDLEHVVAVTISRKHKVNYDLAEDLPKIEGDALQLQQVFLHLISNATEAIGEEEGAISIATGVTELHQPSGANTIFAEPFRPGQYVFLRVTDTGCGMDEQTCAKIFEPFFTTKTSRRGLGLVSVRGIVLAHKGMVQVESQLGQGTTMTVFLPASAPGAEKQRPLVSPGSAQAARPSGPDSAAWRGHGTVLVVDDEATIMQFLKVLLTGLGFTVLGTATGAEGLRIFREKAGEIVLSLVDVTLPDMSGADVLREMRLVRPDTRILLCTGSEASVERFAALNPDGVLQKPYDMNVLVEKVRAAVEG